MTSKALDLTTIAHALTELCNAYFGESEWKGLNTQQEEFLRWYAEHRDEISRLNGLDALAATNAETLNAFLQIHGFDPMFDPFPDGALGVASILDMLIEWIDQGYTTRIRRSEPTGKDIYGRPLNGEVLYPAFSVGRDVVDVYDVDGYSNPLVRLRTKTGHSLWLMKAAEPESGIDLNYQAQQVLYPGRRISSRWTTGVAIVPMLDMDIKPDVSWLIGATSINAQGEYHVEQVFQRFKLRANEKGARVKVATGMVVASANCGPPPPPPYVFDEPFIGFFTQPDHETLPLAAFWADTDVWRTPAGTLEEL